MTTMREETGKTTRREEIGKMRRERRQERQQDRETIEMTMYESAAAHLVLKNIPIFLHTQKQTGDFHPHPNIQQSNTYLIAHNKREETGMINKREETEMTTRERGGRKE